MVFLTLLALLALGMAVIGIGTARSVATELRYLRHRVSALESDLAALSVAPPPPQPSPKAAEPAPVPEPEPEPVLDRVEPWPGAGRADTDVEPPRPKRPLEQILTENWLVWLGGITLALGGAFLVKYSFDQGWIGPTVRVVLGVLLGLGLIAGGHVLAIRRPDWSMGGVDPSYVPPALAGAGSAIVFASLYAAFALYDLIGPLTAFVLLAVVSAGTVLLALRHGQFVALLGLMGGHAVPLLVRTGRHDPWALFAYILLLTAGALLLRRWKDWRILAWAALAASAAWVLLWLGTVYLAHHTVPVGLFILAVFGCAVAVRRGLPRGPEWITAPVLEPPVALLVRVAGWGAALLLLVLVLAAGRLHGAIPLMLAFCAAVLAFARRDQEFDELPLAPALLGLIVLASWDLPYEMLSPDLLRKPMPDLAERFTFAAGVLAALFGGSGFVSLWGARRPGRWAALSAAVPVLTLAAAYWTLSRAGVELAWAAGALALAGVLLAAGERVARWRHDAGMEAALAAYAVGVLAALALAATIALEEAWLTVALAVLLPAVAWVDGHLHVLGLRRVALLVAGVVLVRLAVNPYILDYPLGAAPVFNWLLYGYGLPLLAFVAAAWQFRKGADDLLVEVLEAGAVLLLVLLVSLEIRHLMAGRLDLPRYGLAEQATHSLAWLGIALGLSLARGRRVLTWAKWGLVGLATAQIAILQLIADNPLLTNRPVGEPLLFNLLLLAYAAPALLYALLFRLTAAPAWLWRLCGGMALLLAFVWMSLEVRHAFAGPRLGRAPVEDLELYTYSVVWLLYAGALLGAGLRWKSVALRHAGLGMLLLEVLKVFLVDLSGLTGLWRALSFIGLGGALIGVGYLYRRFVRAPGD